MKKVLSVILGAMMLVSSVSAALPLEQDKTVDPSVTEDVLVAAQTYEDDGASKFFTSKSYDVDGMAIVNEVADDAESNKVMELKFSAQVTYDEEGNVLTAPVYNNSQLIDGKQNTNTLSDGTELPATYMVEFDVCAKDNSIGLVFTRRCLENGVQAAVAIDPDSMAEGTWYTYRFYVDETAYRAVVATAADGKLTTAEANAARAAFVSGVTAFGKERGSSADFVDVTSNLISTTAGNGAMGFVLISSDKNILADDVDQTETYYIEKSKKNVFVDALSVCYQLDNIAVYNNTVPEDYEIGAGIASTYDMNTVTTGTRENGVKFEKITEENGNSYMKISCDYTSEKLTAANAAKVGYSVDNKITTDSNIAEYFSMTFDANNMVAGLALTLEIYSDEDGGYSSAADNKYDYFGRNKFIIKSDANKVGQWYSYKIILDDSADDGNLHARVYRKLRGSDDPWVELATHKGAAANVDPTVHEAFLQGTNSSNVAKARTWRIGYYTDKLSAYGFDTDENKVKNFAGVWAIDNVQFVEGAGVTGTASVADGTVTAKINVSGAKMNCTPIVAIFDENERFVDLGSAKVTGEDAVEVTAEGFEDGYTAKLFIWDSLSAGMPLLKDGIDITNCL